MLACVPGAEATNELHLPAGPGMMGRALKLLAASSAVASHLGWLYGTGRLAVELPVVAREVAEDVALNARIVAGAATTVALESIDLLGLVAKATTVLLFVLGSLRPVRQAGLAAAHAHCAWQHSDA